MTMRKGSMARLAMVAMLLGMACGGTRGSARATPPLVHVSQPAGSAVPHAYPRHCDTSAECDVAWLPLDCCGTMRAAGVRWGSREALEKEVRDARPFAASCECLAGPTLLDSGQTADALTDLVVTCASRVCTTLLRVRSNPGRPHAELGFCRS